MIFILFTLMAVQAAAQQKRCNVLLFKSAEAARQREGMPIKTIKPSKKGDSIMIETDNKKMIQLPTESVWGFQDRFCTLYRNVHKSFLKIEDQKESVIIYSSESKGFKGRIITSYYFSKGFDAPVYRADSKNVHEQLGNNPGLSQWIERKYID